LLLSLQIYVHFFSDEIIVNTEEPERNREVIVTTFPVLKKKGVLYRGYEIILVGDARDFVADRYKATVFDDHTVHIEMPALLHFYLHGSSFFRSLSVEADNFCEPSEDKHDVLHNSIVDILNKNNLLLRFPNTDCLQADGFNDESSSNRYVLENIGYLVKEPYNIGSSPVGFIGFVIRWKVGIVDDSLRTVYKSQPVESLKSKLFKGIATT
jgi:hypothetical protein